MSAGRKLSVHKSMAQFPARKIANAIEMLANAVDLAPNAVAAAAARPLRVRLPREAFGQRRSEWVITHPYRGDAVLCEVLAEV